MMVPRVGEARGLTYRDQMTKLQLDMDGDGVFEMESAPGLFVRERVTTISPPGTEPAPDSRPEPSLF